MVSNAFAALGGGLQPLCRCGEGAYGEVWLARDRLDRSIAVKIVPKSTGSEAWKREFDGIRDYSSRIGGGPHLIAIHHLVEGDDFFCYSMEAADNAASGGRYEADTLGRRLASGGSVPASQIRAIMGQALEGLASLHSKGLFHRDIKPENLLFIGGELKLGDIGCVSGAGREASLVGTPSYLPPEIASGSAQPDATQDVYALGKVLYRLVSGFDAERFPSMPPAALRGRLGRDLNAVMLRACETRPELRYQTAADFAAALEACWDGGARGIMHRFCRGAYAFWSRRPATYAAIVAVAATASVMLAIRSPGCSRLRPPPSPAPPPGSVRTDHVRSPARTFSAPTEPASPRQIDVGRVAGLPMISAASLDDAAVHFRHGLSDPVALLSTPDGQFGVMARGRVTWSCGETSGPTVAMNRKAAREEAFATAKELLAESFMARGEEEAERRRLVLRALAADTSARPVLQRLRAIDPIQKVEVFLRGYAVDSAVETVFEDGSFSEAVTVIATVETAATSVMLDDGIAIATELEGVGDKFRAEAICGCIPLPASRIALVTTRSERRMALRVAVDAAIDDSSLDAAAAADDSSAAEFARLQDNGIAALKGAAPVFRRNYSSDANWIAEACERLRRSPAAVAPADPMQPARARSFLRDGLIYSVRSTITAAEGAER